MSSEKPNFLSQPVVKNIFMFRNGDPYYQARRIVINQKRVSNFETLLREVTGGIQAPFGAVRNIYTPRGGHKVDCMESLQSGEQYVAAGRERFKRLDYQQISSRRKRMAQSLPVQFWGVVHPCMPLPEKILRFHSNSWSFSFVIKPPPPNRIIVSARFLKPIKEPCTIFVVANGDVLNPAMRLLIHQRMLGQFDRILEMITEKMGLRVLGGVRSLYTYEGHQVTDGNQLESGQLYVAVGRERFKKLPYSDLLFTKPRGTRRVIGMKAYSLPPIYRFSKQNGNSKSMVRCSDSGDGDSKPSPPAHNGNSKEHLSSIVREISQARLISLRKKRSGQSMTLGISDNDDLESKADDGNTEYKTPQEQPAEEKPADDDTKATEEDGGKAGEKEEAAVESTAEEDTSANKEEQKGSQESNGEKEGEEEKRESDEQNGGKEGEEEKKESDEQNGEKEGEEEKKESVEQNGEKEGEEEKKESDEQNGEKEGEEEKKESVEQNGEKEGEASARSEEKEEEVEEEVQEEVKGEEQGSSDKTQDSKGKEDDSHTSSEGEKDEQDKNIEEEKADNGSGKREKSSKDQVNDVDTGEEQKEPENNNDPGKTQSDHETQGNDNDRSSSSNSNQEEDVSKTKEGATTESGEGERKVNGEVSGEDDGVGSEAELDTEEKTPAGHKDATANGENGEDGGDGDNQDKSRKEKD